MASSPVDPTFAKITNKGYGKHLMLVANENSGRKDFFWQTLAKVGKRVLATSPAFPIIGK